MPFLCSRLLFLLLSLVVLLLLLRSLCVSSIYYAAPRLHIHIKHKPKILFIYSYPFSVSVSLSVSHSGVSSNGHRHVTVTHTYSAICFISRGLCQTFSILDFMIIYSVLYEPKIVNYIPDFTT